MGAMMNVNVERFLMSRFQKIKLIKQSAKGEIWIVTDSSGKFFILKKLFKIGLPYKILKDNPHKIFPKIIYCAEDEEKTLIVEEFIQGESFFERIRQKNFLNELEAKNFLLQLCGGLKFLHEKNIIHRDIKPEHLIIRGNEIKLIDFDSVHIYKEGQAEDTEKLGTKGYAPPEQYGFSQSDSRNDIYSLGITFQKVLNKNYRGYLKKFLMKCTENNPNDRYQSADELKFAILNYRPSKKLSTKYIFATLIFILILTFHNVTTNKLIQIETPLEKKIIEPKIEKPLQKIIGDFVKVEYYAKGQQLNEWTDNLDYDVPNTGTVEYIKKKIFGLIGESMTL